MSEPDAGRPAPDAARGALPPEVRAGIQELLRTLAGTRITELEVASGSLRLRLQRQAGLPITGTVPTATPEPPDGRTATLHAGTVGTFHRAARAGGEPLAREGSVVAAGQPVGVIATLELVNEVISPIAGTVRQIVVDDGAPVEYGQPLVVIEPADGET